MGINLLGRRALVERDEAVQQIIAGQVVVVAVLVVREVIAQRGARELLSEEIDFVEEENLWGSVRYRWGVKEKVRTIDVLTNHRELHIESKRVRASCIRF